VVRRVPALVEQAADLVEREAEAAQRLDCMQPCDVGAAVDR
jgi:hypothetical protein